jgi:hypothetical protein
MAFDRYMITIRAGHNTKFAHMTILERWTHFHGVLSIAAQAPFRGYLIVGEQEATVAQVAAEAQVSTKVAQSTLEKLKRIGVLERDEDIGAWHVHDWIDFNPHPKRDRTNAERQRRFRERHGNRNAQK